MFPADIHGTETQNNHALQLMARYRETENRDDLEAAITNMAQVVSSLPEHHPHLPKMRHNLAALRFERYQTTGSSDDLEAAISIGEQAVSATPHDHTDRVTVVNNLGSMLHARFERQGIMDDLQASIRYGEDALGATPHNHLDWSARLFSLATRQSLRYQALGHVEDLDSAIQKSDEAISATPSNDRDRAKWLDSLATLLRRRYGRTGMMEDLNSSINKAQEALSATPDDSPDKATRWDTCGSILSSRYQRTGNTGDLEAAIQYTKRALAATPLNHIGRAGRLSNLGAYLYFRSSQAGDIKDLEAAIKNTEQAVLATSQDSPHYAQRLSHLGPMLWDHYAATIGRARHEASISSAQDDPHYATHMDSLEDGLSVEDDRTRSMEHLQRSILSKTQAVVAMPRDHPDYAGLLHSLGTALCQRYCWTGHIESLTGSIFSIREACIRTPDGHRDRALMLENLARLLAGQYSHTMNKKCLEEAILVSKQAVSATPESHFEYASRQENMSGILFDYYRRTKAIGYLEEAIVSITQAISARPGDHLELVAWLGNLGNMYLARYMRTRNADDLEASILRLEEGVSRASNDQPARAEVLSSLGRALHLRYQQSKDTNDLGLARIRYEASAGCVNTKPLTRVRAARNAIRMLQSHEMCEQASQLAQNAVDLLPRVCGRYLSQEDQQCAISHTYGLAADACSLSLKAGDVEKALRQIEFGRGLVLGYMIEGRSDVFGLSHDHPTLAKEFERLRFKMSGFAGLSTIQKGEVRQVEDRTETSRQLEDCLSQIRTKPGYESFLREPDVNDLKQAAAQGPIVIVNVTDISSDAIIVSRTRVEAVHLPTLTSSESSLLARDLQVYRSIDMEGEQVDDGGTVPPERSVPARYSSAFLSWLWDNCVGLIVAKLTELDAYDPSACHKRVWWIGTGVGSSLPFHAAGHYGNHSRGQSAMDQVISSYTPTIRSLVHSRSRAAGPSVGQVHRTSALVVAMRNTPGHMSLPGVDAETAAVRKALGDAFTAKVLEHPSARQVLDHMKDADIVHFACHGAADLSDPSSSHLLLQTTSPSGSSVNKLAVQSIFNANHSSRKEQIAYLSACSRAEVKVTQSPDEALHLVSAFQVAGFGHVIGSLWPTDDDTGAKIAGCFYKNLAGDEPGHQSVAKALHDAVQEVRQNLEPRLWVPYIHSGA
jgi:hypothetical protein